MWKSDFFPCTTLKVTMTCKRLVCATTPSSQKEGDKSQRLHKALLKSAAVQLSLTVSIINQIV